MKRYILTGTPGAGKTTLLHELKRKGYAVIEEAATDIIAFEQANGITEPWTDSSFIDKIIQLQIDREYQAKLLQSPLQFFDRSPICTYALCVFLGYSPPFNLIHEIHRMTTEHAFQRDVFFIENLGFIQPTTARQISLDDALRFERIHKDIYQNFGYRLIHIPPMDIFNRITYLMEHLQSTNI